MFTFNLHTFFIRVSYAMILLSSLVSYSLMATIVETEISSQLQTIGKAKVIVILHDPIAAYLDEQQLRTGLNEAVSDELHKKLIAQAQAAVLSSLSNRYRSEPQTQLKRQYRYIPALAGSITPAALTVLRHHPQVASIQLDKPRQFQLADTLPLLQVDAVHALPYTGNGVIVAVLDTGIDSDHPDLADSIVAQHCFSFASCPPFDSDESDSAQQNIYYGEHGTHIAGIITSPQGIAPDAKIVAIKVSSRVGIYDIPRDSDILAGLDWIRANLETLPVKIITLSLGGGYFSTLCDEEQPAYHYIFQQLTEQGVTIFASAGNDGFKNEISFPACYSNVIAVGATNMADTVAHFSNSSPLVELLAPGVNITSSFIGGGQVTHQGTSFASPIAAGVAALMLEANPSLTPLQIKTLMKNTGVKITDAKNGLTFPRINALATVQAAQQAKTQFSFTAKGYQINEEVSTITLEVSRLGNSQRAASINYTTIDGSAIAGEDYRAISGTLVWQADENSNKNIVITILNDDDLETFEETFLVSLHNPNGSFVDRPQKQSVPVTILDNESAGQIEFTGVSMDTRIDDFLVFDINYGAFEYSDYLVTVEVSRQHSSLGTVSVDYQTLDGTAIAGSDYIANQGTLTWNDGDMENKTFTVQIVDDTVFEGKEMFTVILSNPSKGATLGKNTQQTIVITDDEKGLGITDGSFEEVVSTDLPHSVWQGGTSHRRSPIQFHPDLARTGNSVMSFGHTAVPTITSAKQTVIIPPDVTALNFWLKIPESSGKTSDFLTVSLGRNIDGFEFLDFGIINMFESMKDKKPLFSVTAEEAAYYADYQLVSLNLRDFYDDEYTYERIESLYFDSEVSGGDTNSTHFVIDDVELVRSQAGSFWLSQTDYTVNETAGVLTFEVGRFLGDQGAASISYMTSDQTATGELDYMPASGTLTWQDGEWHNKSFTVTINNDDYFEPDETFKVSVFNPTGGTSLQIEPVIVTILNDEEPVEGVMDGSFELGSPNPVWNQTDSWGTSPICSHTSCGSPDFPSHAYAGEYFAWFGSAFSPRKQSLNQTFIIPTNTKTLTFWLQIPSADSAGELTVHLDDNLMFSVTQSDAAIYSDYTFVMLDIGAYADGQIHRLRFDSFVPGGGAMRFFVDDVALSF